LSLDVENMLYLRGQICVLRKKPKGEDHNIGKDKIQAQISILTRLLYIRQLLPITEHNLRKYEC